MSVKVLSLVKKFGSQTAVNQVSFTIGAGEIVGFLGPNGAGKSTTMKMMTGYLPPDSGEINICGIDVKKNGLEARKRIGYLPESNPLYYEMYVSEFLHFIGGIYSIPNRRKRVKEIIDVTGLGPERSKKIGALSKGYKQRVGLAHALINDPEVLILDEPTSGLDPNQLVGIRTLIKEIGKEKTVLFSTHIMQEVEALCDRVIIINKGEIVADDKMKYLKSGSSKKEILRILLNRPLPLSVLTAIQGIDKVQEVDGSTYLLEFTANIEVRGRIFEVITDHERIILEMSSQESGIEDIFRKLTDTSI